jgi:hypothetical protein
MVKKVARHLSLTAEGAMYRLHYREKPGTYHPPPLISVEGTATVTKVRLKNGDWGTPLTSTQNRAIVTMI